MTSLEIPDFLSRIFFVDAVKFGMSIKIQIKSLDISAGSSNGDNYCSDIYRAVILYDDLTGKKVDQKLSLIVKAMPYSEGRGPILENLQVFSKEVEMYAKTLPKITAMMDNEVFSAKYFYSIKSPVQTIVFQDLMTLGYKMSDREKGLDKAHSMLVMKKLGHFHAGSYALANKNLESLKEYSFGLMHEKALDTPVYKGMITDGVQYFTELVDTWVGFEKISKRLKEISADLKDRISKHLKVTPIKYKVLNHGDLWMNNILFKYNRSDVPEEVIFVDYQMSYYSSPGIDINYFLTTSVRDKLTDKEKHDIIAAYYEAFSSSLRRMNISNIPTFEILMSEIAAQEFYGLVVAMVFLPIMLLDKTTSQESSIDAFGEAEKGQMIREAMYNNETYKNLMKKLLLRLYNLNVI